jgi:hypothetical protein
MIDIFCGSNHYFLLVDPHSKLPTSPHGSRLPGGLFERSIFTLVEEDLGVVTSRVLQVKPRHFADKHEVQLVDL